MTRILEHGREAIPLRAIIIKKPGKAPKIWPLNQGGAETMRRSYRGYLLNSKTADPAIARAASFLFLNSEAADREPLVLEGPETLTK